MFKNLKKSAKSLKDTRVLCTSAIMAALYVVLYAVKIPLTPDDSLRITFTFIPLALSGWLFGPVPAAIVGFVGDIAGFLLSPSKGPYFPGFTLSSILTGFLFGLILYKANSKNCILKAILSKTCVSAFVNVFLNSLWLSFLYEKAWVIYAGSHLVKNLILLPLEIVILIIIIKLLSSRNIEKMYK